MALFPCRIGHVEGGGLVEELMLGFSGVFPVPKLQNAYSNMHAEQYD